MLGAMEAMTSNLIMGTIEQAIFPNLSCVVQDRNLVSKEMKPIH